MRQLGLVHLHLTEDRSAKRRPDSRSKPNAVREAAMSYFGLEQSGCGR